jgi:hypothetical protein
MAFCRCSARSRRATRRCWFTPARCRPARWRHRGGRLRSGTSPSCTPPGTASRRGRGRASRRCAWFAALAGGAPLHVERLAGRGGPAAAAFDPLTFYDTSSYGPRAIEAVGGVVGLDQLVHGSDRPVLGAPPEHGLGAAGDHALTATNPARLLTGAPAALEVAA